MKIAILSRSPAAYSTRRLKAACRERGHDVKVLNTLRFSIFVEAGNPQLYYQGRRLSQYDAVVPRIGASVTQFGTAVVRQFEQMGVFTLASSQAVTVSRDKLRSIQVLSRHSIGLPPTAFARDRTSLMQAIEQVGGAPVVIKLLEGTQGIGVMLADHDNIAEAIIETLQSAKQNVLIQKFVRESKGRDVRAFVIGDRVVAAMRRIAVGAEFRSNMHRGGRAEPVKLDENYERTAIRAAQILGLQVAGVDMLEAATGPQVMEVNSSPGLEGVETVTGIDVAGAIVQHLEEQVLFPELDLRQRLTLKSGYGVAEFRVFPESELAGRTLREAGLRARDVQVLSITRGSVVLPNPRGDDRLLPHDVLLCFGKLMTLKHLMPPPAARSQRKPALHPQPSFDSSLPPPPLSALLRQGEALCESGRGSAEPAPSGAENAKAAWDGGAYPAQTNAGEASAFVEVHHQPTRPSARGETERDSEAHCEFARAVANAATDELIAHEGRVQSLAEGSALGGVGQTFSDVAMALPDARGLIICRSDGAGPQCEQPHSLFIAHDAPASPAAR
jgi:ribosomal protein S6--L-glutamate ligase